MADGPPRASDGAASKPKLPKGKGKKGHGVSRMRLPGIESYEKELEFTAEGPGRVVVRLERLMGSDRIRITDPKYLATLMERLEGEETSAWVSRSWFRKKSEKNRSRQLAIDGLMDPTEDMQDLYNHPVFRVNRVLKRLERFDSVMSAPGSTMKLPPIHPEEPFSEDPSGVVFKRYSGHAFVFEGNDDLHPDSPPPVRDMQWGPPQTDAGKADGKKKKKKDKAEATKADKISSKPPKGSDEEADDDEEEGDEEDDEEEGDESGSDSAKSGDEPTEMTREMKLAELPDTLEDLQRYYTVPSDENLTRNWQPFKSHLVDMVYDETEDTTALFTVGDDVEGVYAREYLTAEDHVNPLNQKVKTKLDSGAYNTPIVADKSKSNVASKTNIGGMDEGEDEEEGDDGEEAATEKGTKKLEDKDSWSGNIPLGAEAEKPEEEEDAEEAPEDDAEE